MDTNKILNDVVRTCLGGVLILLTGSVPITRSRVREATICLPVCS